MRFLSLIAAILLALAAPLAWSADFNDETAILVAKREMHDRVYGSSVIVVRPLGQERHIGFIVNKPTTMTLGKLFPKHPPSQKVVDPVYLGGPMGPEVIFAMVKGASPGGRSLQLTPGVYVAFDSAVVDRIIESQPQEARFLAGMVLWQPHELAEEVKRGLWYVLDPKPDVLLQRKATDGLWEDLVGRAERKANTI